MEPFWMLVKAAGKIFLDDLATSAEHKRDMESMPSHDFREKYGRSKAEVYVEDYRWKNDDFPRENPYEGQ